MSENRMLRRIFGPKRQESSLIKNWTKYMMRSFIILSRYGQGMWHAWGYEKFIQKFSLKS
jgi:hypothetical protein